LLKGGNGAEADAGVKGVEEAADMLLGVFGLLAESRRGRSPVREMRGRGRR
jgi:hypothetical protein